MISIFRELLSSLTKAREIWGKRKRVVRWQRRPIRQWRHETLRLLNSWKSYSSTRETFPIDNPGKARICYVRYSNLFYAFIFWCSNVSGDMKTNDGVRVEDSQFHCFLVQYHSRSNVFNFTNFCIDRNERKTIKISTHEVSARRVECARCHVTQSCEKASKVMNQLLLSFIAR